MWKSSPSSPLVPGGHWKSVTEAKPPGVVSPVIFQLSWSALIRDSSAFAASLSNWYAVASGVFSQ